ncbi:Aste57867_8468 [Aphanomyces stellatus]|uniref:Aste57867_8468 protein n=1 Tax=Aphanomyces stellatus TaxID=120398 RepID=A0A485KKC9_9STRA|nr:hypothetical protein As57867_008436 [Aphanomyces stellatus]VFT85354.1 Aste57867_8468 [Aphanomyces stellatus]
MVVTLSSTTRPSKARRLPLPKDCFRPAPLSPIAQSMYMERARSGFDDLVFESCSQTATDSPIRWKLDTTVETLQVFTGSDPNAPPQSATVLGVTTVQGTIDELPRLLRFDTHGAFEDFNMHFHSDVVDCASLYTLVDTPAEWIGIKWEALQSPVSGLMKLRDAAFVECAKEFIQNGRRGWARSMESVDVACCPDLTDALGLVRMLVHRSGYVFREVPQLPGTLQVTYMLNASLRGRAPKWMARMALRSRAKALGGLDTYFRHRRLQAPGVALLPPASLVPVADRRRCCLCHSKLHGLASRFNCSVCGDVTCPTCQQVWYLHVKFRKVSVCNHCSVAPRTVGGGLARRRPSLTSKSGTHLSCTVLEGSGASSDDDGSSPLTVDGVDADRAVAARPRRRESAPVSAPRRPPTSSTPLRMNSVSEPPMLVHLYSAPQLSSDERVIKLLGELEEMGFDPAMLAQLETMRGTGLLVGSLKSV